MQIRRLIVEADREDHTARHGVALDEVWEVVYGVHVAERMRGGRYGLIGQIGAGRYLMVVIAPRGRGAFGLVTARDASDAERKRFREHVR